MTVPANTDDQQGVSVPPLDFTGVTFWCGGTTGALVASGPCCMMISGRGDGTAQPPPVISATTGSSLRLTFGDLSTTVGVTQKIAVTPGRGLRPAGSTEFPLRSALSAISAAAMLRSRT
ncbi:polysaccharide lyase beta-sandwich domain-containing protein [Streptomyces sp. NPDC001157]